MTEVRVEALGTQRIAVSVVPKGLDGVCADRIRSRLCNRPERRDALVDQARHGLVEFGDPIRARHVRRHAPIPTRG